jgi:hypothetical protein
MQLKFAKWSVSGIFVEVGQSTKEPWLIGRLTQNGKQGENKSVADANAAAMAEAGSASSS